MLLTNLLPSCRSVYHLPLCIQTFLSHCSHLICPTYSLLHKLRLANNPFSVQFPTCMILVRCVCVWKRQKGVNAEGLQHMVASAHDVSVVLGTCWRPHTVLEHGTLRGLCLSPPLLPVCLCLASRSTICLSSRSAPVCCSAPSLQRQPERDGEKGKNGKGRIMPSVNIPSPLQLTAAFCQVCCYCRQDLEHHHGVLRQCSAS